MSGNHENIISEICLKQISNCSKSLPPIDRQMSISECPPLRKSEAYTGSRTIMDTAVAPFLLPDGTFEPDEFPHLAVLVNV